MTRFFLDVHSEKSAVKILSKMNNSVQQNNYFCKAFQFLPMMRETAGVRKGNIFYWCQGIIASVLELQGHVNVRDSERLHCYGKIVPLNKREKTLKHCKKVISATIWVIWKHAIAQVGRGQFFLSFPLSYSPISVGYLLKKKNIIFHYKKTQQSLPVEEWTIKNEIHFKSLSGICVLQKYSKVFCFGEEKGVLSFLLP